MLMMFHLLLFLLASQGETLARYFRTFTEKPGFLCKGVHRIGKKCPSNSNLHKDLKKMQILNL